MAGRDITGISLDSAPKAGALTLGIAAPAGTPPAPQASAPSLVAVDDYPVPKTYEEALGVLGASPDAAIVAIKKIVDGLRQSWHPDHAVSEADRVGRERRLRQVNVAWDLVSQRRSAA